MKTFIQVLLLTAIVFSAIPTADTVTNSIGMKFKRIAAGTFKMGYEGSALPTVASFGNLRYGLYNEYPAHNVTFSSDFYMGVFEVVNKQFKQFSPSHGTGISWYQGGDSVPATALTWYAADSFCKWMTANDPNGWTYRLPTEAEWEYCCRAGTTTVFSTGDSLTSSQAYTDCYGSNCNSLKKIGYYPPNSWGLYDMYQNAKEWCLDWYGPYNASDQSNPAGCSTSEYKVWRGSNFPPLFFLRSSARGGAIAQESSHKMLLGFRVVMTNSLPVVSATPDTVTPYSKNIAESRPSPATFIVGESYTDADGLGFVRTRITRGNGRYPVQKDSVVYVSTAPISGDSGIVRHLAGALAEKLSRKSGVLYRISNRYELADAGILPEAGNFHLTIIPDIKYPEGCFGHPDLSHYVSRTAPQMPTLPDSLNLGYVNYKVNHFSHIAECPNGDILANWYSGASEDYKDLNQAGTRLRLGSTQWDSVVQISDIPLVDDMWLEFWDDGKGNLFKYVVNWMTSCAYVSVSTDNGKHWSQPWFNANVGPTHSIYRMGGDTVIASAEANVVSVNGLALSLDGGRTWSLSNRPFNGDGYHISGALFDDRSFMIFLRGVKVKNSDSVATCYSALTRDIGTTWQALPTPFYPPNIGQYNAALKLQSGRLLFALHCNVPGKLGVILAESEDNGKTWFCRRKFGTSIGGNGDFMAGYMSMCQGRDGIIHLQGTKGSSGGLNGQLPQASFSEQWLRNGTCLDVTEWGVNTAGMVADCSTEDTLHTHAKDVFQTHDKRSIQLATLPNPFNPSTTLHFSIPSNSTGRIYIFDVGGQMIRSFHIKNGQTRGHVVWDGNNMQGKTVTSGVYMSRLSLNNGQTRNIRMTLMK